MSYDLREELRRLSVWKEKVGYDDMTLASDEDREFISDMIKIAYEHGYLSPEGMDKRLSDVHTVPVRTVKLAKAVENIPIHRAEFHGTGVNLPAKSLALPKLPRQKLVPPRTFFIILSILEYILIVLFMTKVI